MRVIIDNNILISGLIWGGTPYQVLVRIDEGRDVSFTSRDILIELQTVLQRPKLAGILSARGLSWENIAKWLIAHSTLVLPKPAECVLVESDPADDIFLLCARACQADVVVSGDRHLLDLAVWEGIRIVSAAQFIKKEGGAHGVG
jgi:putative PIN family toxin of toxin-antitoxin system